MTSSANLTFRTKINAAVNNGLSGYNPAPSEFEAQRRHQHEVAKAYASYLTRRGIEAADCSRLSGDKRRELENFGDRLLALIEDEFLALLKEAEAAASTACLEAAE